MPDTFRYLRLDFCLRPAKLAAVLALAIALLSLFPAAEPALAQTLTVLHAFAGQPDGQYPGGVMRDSQGNLYGTTLYGGAHNWGTVFKITKLGRESVLYSFTGGTDGAIPAGVIRDGKGNSYGTAVGGGNLNCLSTSSPPGCGTVFRLDTAGKLTVLHRFSSTPDGALPIGVIRDAAGNLYGTTQYGGATTVNGTVYKLGTAGKETILYSFKGGADGSGPTGGLVPDSAGNLYGCTVQGGAGNWGTVFKVDSSGNESLLHTFTSGAADGAYPNGPLIRDSSGNLYGTTTSGGSSGGGPGIIFKVDASAVETILHTFGAVGDGSAPSSGLLRDSAGNMYGTTSTGGEYDWGTVYKLDTTGTETVLYSFAGGTDGKYPGGTLILDGAGNLYGTTQQGGRYGLGVVFKLKP
jgi:uncharacterized repeat protein (TIGR03803 family)